MKLSICSTSAAIGCLALAASGASAAVIGATVADASSGDYTLTSVSVTRSGAGTFTYTPAQLIGIDLTDVDAYQIPLLTQANSSLPAPGTRATLIEDGRLDTGVINITTTNGTPDRSVEVTFARPVVNSAGEDILLFEVGGDDNIRFWINNDRTSQSADLTTGAYSTPLLTGVPFTLFSYNDAGDQDIGGSNGESGLAELESPTGFSFNANSSGAIEALGLDLSSVGVPLGGSVRSIRFQSLTGGGRLDPVLIVGLPAVPEPAGVALLGVAALALRRGRRVTACAS